MEAMIFCPKCGVKNLISAKVCISCGKSMEAAAKAESKYAKRPIWKTVVGYVVLVPMILRVSEGKYATATLCLIISVLAFMPRLKREPREGDKK
jgi:uncharacterized membrane protein YvbJ